MDEGQRFSLLYLEKSTLLKDSPRFRMRIIAFYEEYLHKQFNENIKKSIEKELGVEIFWELYNGWNLELFFKESELRDILDSITLIYRGLANLRESSLSEKWMNFVTKALSEENLGYRLDSKCGVHYFVDEEFERNRFSALRLLDDQKYTASRAAYEDAYRHMDSDSPDTKAAVRSIFESLEILVKQMVKTANLNKRVVQNTLKEKCLKIYENDETASKVVSEMFDGFAKWVNGMHNYRHGQASDKPVAPSEEMAIYILSSGSSFLRWLIDFDNASL